MQRVPDPLGSGPKSASGAGKCDVPGIFVNDPAEAWNFSDGIVTEVRPRALRASRAGRTRARRPPCDASPTEVRLPDVPVTPPK